MAPQSSAVPQRIYLANDDHTDYMWSADADTYNQVFVDLLDFHLDLADQTAGNPPEYRARFNTDGNYWLWNYERKKSPEAFARLIERIKDGTISSPLNTLVSCYGAQPAEAVLRGMYYAGRLERRHGLRFRLANATENQTLPLGIASLFAGSGADYTWRGVCGCASRLPFRGVLNNRPREIYWHAGPDGRRQLMKWYSLARYNFGGYWEAGFPLETIEYVTHNEDFRRRYSDPASGKTYSVFGIFGYGGDDLARKTGVEPPPPTPAVPGLQAVPSSPYTDHFHLIAEALTDDTRQVIVSNEQDFFEEFERRHGETLDTLSVTYGNEWDLYSASMAETSARVKRAVEKLRASELLATLVSLKYPRFMDTHVGARDRAFQDLGLYWEHDWTADGPVTRGQRAAWHDLLASRIEYYVNSIHAEGIVRLGGMIPRPDKSANRFFVLNPLGWSRTDFADHPHPGSADIHVHDLAAGRDVPHQIITIHNVRHIRILASEVPPAGYTVYEIRSGTGSAPDDPAAAGSVSGDSQVFENAAIRLVVARDGAIRSFTDKRLGAVDFAADIGGLHLNDFAPGSDDGDPLRIENAGPVSVTLRARSDAGLPHTTAITLYRGSDRVDIRNEITTNFGDIRYWSFGFNLPKPTIRTEEVGAININKPSSQGGAYADTHARYDHVTLNHFADITSGDGTRGMTLSNPDLAFARLGNSTDKVLDTSTPQINVLAGGQIDGANLGIRNQNGAIYFLQRFALRGHSGYDQPAAMRFALEHQNPFLTGALLREGPDGASFPEATYSLLSTGSPDVLLWAVKPAEEGIDRGIVVRLWNLSEAPTTTTLAFTPDLAGAHRTTHIETDLEAIPLTAPGTLPARFARQQIQTYRLLLK